MNNIIKEIILEVIHRDEFLAGRETYLNPGKVAEEATSKIFSEIKSLVPKKEDLKDIEFDDSATKTKMVINFNNDVRIRNKTIEEVHEALGTKE